MKQIIIGIVAGIILGVALLYSGLYISSLNARVTGIEKFLNNAIQAQNQQRPAPIPAK